MNNMFSGYYRPTDDEFKAMWKQALFVFDANVLLNFYQYSETTRKEFLAILKKIGNRIWIPHQVALEYQENRLSKISQQLKTFTELKSLLFKTKGTFQTILTDDHPSIKVDHLRALVATKFSDIERELDTYSKTHPNLREKDFIRDELTALFGDNVGQPYNQDRLNEINKEGEKRYAAAMPPGYKDADTKKSQSKRFGTLLIQAQYGDLIIWFQMLDKAKAMKIPVILVTDDRKADWWLEDENGKVGPRPELITEMVQSAQARFYMYTSDQFIKFAPTYLDVMAVSPESLKEVENVAEPRLDWKSEVFNALFQLHGEGSLSDIYEAVEVLTKRELPESWQAIVRKTLYENSSDSDAFTGNDDLFVNLGKGIWGLREHVSSSQRGFLRQDLQRLVQYLGNELQQVNLLIEKLNVNDSGLDHDIRDRIRQAVAQMQGWLKILSPGDPNLVMLLSLENQFALASARLQDKITSMRNPGRFG